MSHKCFNPACINETINPKYCSKSCSASHTNTLYPKRKTTRKCSLCDELVEKYSHTKCKKHRSEQRKNSCEFRTIGHYRKTSSLKDKHVSWKHTHIRQFARSWLRDLRELPCANCGYDKHVELCHIKPLKDFSDSALLKDVNSRENVIQLCRNCHWEFDNGLLDIKAGDGGVEPQTVQASFNGQL